MPHNESQSVSRMKENFTSGLTGRGWEPTYDLVNKSLHNRKSGATGYHFYEARHQSFTLLAVLVQILAQAIQQLYQLKQIFGTAQDTLGLMRDINRGIRDGLAVIRIINPKFNPGLYGGLETADQVQRAIEDLYGAIPQTSEYRLQEAQDKSVAESISMNGTLFQYADNVDDEAKRIIAHSQSTNPQGSAKLTNQALAVLIGVTTQVLRTNSMMLKMMGQNMALSNRKEKLQATQFKTQYEGISNALGTLPKETNLSPMSTSGR